MSQLTKSKSITEVVKNLGIDSVSKLAELNLLDKLYNYDVVQIVKGLGLDSIPPLFKVGAKFNKLCNYQIDEIVKSLGLDSILPLFEAGAKFDELYDHQIVEIVKSFGLDSIFDFAELKILEKLDPYNIGQIVVQIVKGFGLDAIHKLLAAGVKFDELYNHQIAEIVQNLGVDSVPKLVELKLLDKLNNSDIAKIEKIPDADFQNTVYHEDALFDIGNSAICRPVEYFLADF